MSRDEGYIVLTNWVDFKMSSLTTGTINAYLGTWKNPDFCHRGVSKAFTPRIFGNAILKLKGWRRTIDIDLRTQRTQRIFDKCDNHLTNDHVESFYQTKQVREAYDLFEGTTEAQVLTECQLTDARDLP